MSGVAPWLRTCAAINGGLGGGGGGGGDGGDGATRPARITIASTISGHSSVAMLGAVNDIPNDVKKTLANASQAAGRLIGKAEMEREVLDAKEELDAVRAKMKIAEGERDASRSALRTYKRKCVKELDSLKEQLHAEKEQRNKLKKHHRGEMQKLHLAISAAKKEGKQQRSLPEAMQRSHTGGKEENAALRPAATSASIAARVQAQTSADVNTSGQSQQSVAAQTSRGQKRAADAGVEADEVSGQPAAKQRRVAVDPSSTSDEMLIEDDDAEVADQPLTHGRDSHATVLGISDDADQAVVRAAYRQRICDAASEPGDAGSDGRHSKQVIRSAFEALSAGPGNSPTGASGAVGASAAAALGNGEGRRDPVAARPPPPVASTHTR